MYVVPDLSRTDPFICMGGSSLASQGSLMGTPNAKAAIEAIRARGDRPETLFEECAGDLLTGSVR